MPVIDFEPFFELSSDLLAILGADGLLVRTNASFETQLGWKKEELSGKPFLSLIHAADAAAAAAHVGAATASSGPHPFTTHVCHASGGHRQVRWLVSRQPECADLLLAGTIATGPLTSTDS